MPTEETVKKLSQKLAALQMEVTAQREIQATQWAKLHELEANTSVLYKHIVALEAKVKGLEPKLKLS
jgi:hypothetical protein